MPKFQHRSQEAELMDDLSLNFEEFQETLEQIEFINHLTFAYQPTINAIQHFKKIHFERLIAEQDKTTSSSKKLRILDAGCGHGDQLREIFKWAVKKDITVELIGVDINPTAKQAAELALKKQNLQNTDKQSIEFHTADIFDFAQSNGKKFDVIISSLFTHHLSNELIINLLQWMSKNSELGYFINDLHRHPLAYYIIKYFTALVGFNRLVKNDAPLSVARAFKKEDWVRLITDAKLDLKQLNIKWYWTFRYCLTYQHHAVK